MAKHSGPLNPDARATLRDVLRPPDGYRLEHCLATAYSLDAETLITIPLFAAGISAEEIDKPLGIARIFETASRLTLLVQGDRIGVSKRWKKARALLRLTGDSIVPCSVKGGSFHPKLLVLDFRSIQKEKAKPHHRVVISTRNLTTDNSWDSVVVLEEDSKGAPIDGLGEAVANLARFVNTRKHPAIEKCKQYGSALKSVNFQPPRGLEELEVQLFYPGSGNAKKIKSQIQGDDLLVISPFVRQGFLDELAQQADRREHRWLVTRPVDVPKSAFDRYRVFKIADAAVPTHATSRVKELEDDPDEGTLGRLVSLHAKIYVASAKNQSTRVVITSANATPAGWNTNVEVAVSGLASGKAFQVQSIVAPGSGERGEQSFGDLLEEFTWDAVECEKPDPPWHRQARSVLSQAHVVGCVSKGPPKSITIKVLCPTLDNDWPAGAEVTIHPFGHDTYSARGVQEMGALVAQMPIDEKMELVPFVTLVISMGNEPPLEIVLFMQLEGDLEWSREDARKALVQARSGEVLQDLLWYLGVKGGGVSPKRGVPDTVTKQHSTQGVGLPLLEKLLLRVHALDAKSQIEIVDGLLEGVTEDLEYGRALSETWELVKASLK